MWRLFVMRALMRKRECFLYELIVMGHFNLAISLYFLSYGVEMVWYFELLNMRDILWTLDLVETFGISCFMFKNQYQKLISIHL